MIPLRDSIRSRRFPAVTVALIAANLLVFLYEIALPRPVLAELFLRFGLVPRAVTEGLPMTMVAGLVPVPVPLLTSIFLHGGWLHVLGNMLYLWVFGDNVEDRLGRLGFLVLYLAAGVAGNMSHVLANPQSPVPTIGASGAVAGVLGAYFISFPRARVLALVPLGIFLHVAEVPAVLFLVLWFVLQLVNGVGQLGVPSQVSAGVAWWAHVGGFAAGFALLLLLRPGRRSYLR